MDIVIIFTSRDWSAMIAIILGSSIVYADYFLAQLLEFKAVG